MEVWNIYQRQKVVHLCPFLDHVPILLLLGIPLLIVGSAFTIKGMKEYLTGK